MDKLNQTLSVIFYLVWIPLGILLLAGIVFVGVANPFAGMLGMFGGNFSTQETLEHEEQDQSPSNIRPGEPPAGFEVFGPGQ